MLTMSDSEAVVRFLFFFLLASPMACAQAPSFGFKGGIPISSLLTAATPQFRVVNHRYTLGPTAELGLPHRLTLEADLLYKRLEYRYSRPDFSALDTGSGPSKASRWEIPVLLHYKLAGRRLQARLGLGGSFDRVVHVSGVTVAQLRHRSTRGIV